MHGTGARVMATTHYPELKAYGYNRPGVANASVEFDVETLSPTYKLLIGVPGRSNAFEISERLGLPEYIISQAQTYTGTDRGEVNSMIASLEDSRRQAEKDAEETEEQLEEAKLVKENLEQRLSRIGTKERAIRTKSKRKSKKNC